MAEGVVEKIDITIIDPEALDEEARKLKKLERIAKGAQTAQAKITGGKGGKRKMVESLGPSEADLTKDFEELKAKVERLEEFETKFSDELGKLSTFANNPVGWITRQFTGQKFIAKFIGVIVALKAFEAARQHIVEDWLGDGGGGDVRVKVMAIVRTIPELAKMLDIRSGKVFFSPVKGIFQGVGMTANTDNKHVGMQRFTQIHGGTSMISDLLT